MFTLRRRWQQLVLWHKYDKNCTLMYLTGGTHCATCAFWWVFSDPVTIVLDFNTEPDYASVDRCEFTSMVMFPNGPYRKAYTIQLWMHTCVVHIGYECPLWENVNCNEQNCSVNVIPAQQFLLFNCKPYLWLLWFTNVNSTTVVIWPGSFQI